MTTGTPWPPLALAEWQETCLPLHMWTQVVGKTQLALTPLMNHWWNVTFRVSPQGLRTHSLFYGDITLEMEFDLIHHKLLIETSEGADRQIAFYPRSVADFYSEYLSTMKSLGIEVKINTTPSELPDPIPFEQDHKHAAYDKECVDRFRRRSEE